MNNEKAEYGVKMILGKVIHQIMYSMQDDPQNIVNKWMNATSIPPNHIRQYWTSQMRVIDNHTSFMQEYYSFTPLHAAAVKCTRESNIFTQLLEQVKEDPSLINIPDIVIIIIIHLYLVWQKSSFLCCSIIEFLFSSTIIRTWSICSFIRLFRVLVEFSYSLLDIIVFIMLKVYQ